MVSDLLKLKITLLPRFRNFRITGICQGVEGQGDVRLNGFIFRIREICSKLRKDCFSFLSIWGSRYQAERPCSWVLRACPALRGVPAGADSKGGAHLQAGHWLAVRRQWCPLTFSARSSRSETRNETHFVGLSPSKRPCYT